MPRRAVRRRFFARVSLKVFHSHKLSRQLSREGQGMLGGKTDVVIMLCPPEGRMKRGGRVGNTEEEEDSVGAAFHCGGCRGGRSEGLRHNKLRAQFTKINFKSGSI